jgi:acyl carrier protein
MTASITLPQGTSPEPLDRFPCSATQERCWFLDRMNPGTPALNVAIRWSVTGHFSAAAFEAAFRTVIARHEILRTRFVEEAGRPVQQVMDRASFHLSEIDIRTAPEDEHMARVEAIATENAALPFDLTHAGLLRATLIRLGEDRAILAITVHQICFDGWSIGILGREIGAVAAAHEAGASVDLPELPLQFGDYALWQHDYFESAAFAQDLAPWRDRLAGAPYFELQPDFPRPLERGAACANVKTDLPQSFGERLADEAKARAMSPFSYGAGVLSAMLARCAKVPEVTIGTQVAGRTEVDLEPLIGVFINNVVMRFPTPSEVTLNDHLTRAHSVVQDALIGQHIPFNKLVEIVNPGRDPSRTPLISVNFILQHAFMETARYGEFELSSVASHAPGAIYDLSFVLIGRETGWRMTLEYNSELFSSDTAEELLVLWQEAFSFAFNEPHRSLAEMPEPKTGVEARREEARHLERIETALIAHPQVAAAATVPYSGVGDARCIHAFVTPDTTAPILPLETLPGLLTDYLEVDLANAVRPNLISVLRDLPRDDAGQVLKTQLPLAAAIQGRAMMSALNPNETPPKVEQRLAEIWADLLGLEAVPPSANFFELGGHSLLTVRMLARIELEFGRRLSLATAYYSPTLRALARHLTGAEEATVPSGKDDWRVLVLQEAGYGIPLIAINNAQTVYALAGSMAHPRPALAVRTYDKSRGITLTPRSFDQIAADYVDAVRSAQPKGPYALFGVCVHGNLAIEVARQLKAQGEEVAAVILKDVWEPRYADRTKANRWTSILDKLHFLRVRLRFLRRGDISLSAFCGNFRFFRNSGLLSLAVRLRLTERVRSTDLNAEQEEFVAYLSEARNRHYPEPYDGTVLHFVTSEAPSGRAFDPTMGWSAMVTGRLLTHQLKELSIAQGRNFGVEEAAQEIEALLESHKTDVLTKGQVNAK